MILRKMTFRFFALALILTACTPQTTPATTVAPTPVVGRLTFAGSTTVQPLAGDIGKLFQQVYPQVVLDIAAGGSVVGIQAVQEGTADIGMASRALSAEEAEGIQVYQVAIDVLAIIVNPNNPVNDLSFEQLTQIYRGEIPNWSQVGGPDLAIIPVARAETSGTRGAFDEIVLDKEAPAAPALQIAITAGDVAAFVSNDPAAIGYIGFGNIEPSLKVISISGVSPSPDTAIAGTYPLLRPLSLMTGPLTQPLATLYIEFALSPEGQALVEQAGWVPVR